MSLHTQRRRWLRRLSVPFALGLLLALLPQPQFTFSAVSVLDRVPLLGDAEAAAAEMPPLAEEDAHDHEAGDHEAGDHEAGDHEAGDHEAGNHEAGAVGERVAASADEVEKFTAIGVLLDEAPTAPVMLRTRDSDGEWGSWREFELQEDEGPDRVPGAGPVEGDGAPFGTAPVWVGDATGYEVNLAAHDAEHAEVALVRDEQRRAVTDATPLADAMVPTPFDIRSRSSWGARPTSTSVASTVRLAVVHHSDSSNSYSPDQVPGVLRSIQAYHMDGRGWSDIAYNFVVDKYGGVWEGRGGGIDRPVTGAHAMGFNTNTVGLMVIGDYTQATPTTAAIESVSRVIGWKMALHDVDPSTNVAFTSGGSNKYPAGAVVNLPRVVGHQDVGQTSCPGSIQGFLGQIRSRSQQWTSYVRTTVGPQGAFGGVVAGADGTLTAIGWVVDLDVTGPSEIVLSSDGRAIAALADVPRDDVASLYPGQGPNHGFWVRWGGFSPGWHEVCITAVNRGSGVNTDLGCRSAVVPDASGRSPVGRIAASAGPPGMVDVFGWVNGSDGRPVPAGQITVDGGWRRTVAGAGYQERLVGITAGRRQVCIVDAGVRVDCTWVQVGQSGPLGRIDGISAGPGMITTSGWAYDPESLDPVVVALIIDGRWYTGWASRARDDWASTYPAYGDVHGFALGAEVAPGTHWTCVAALNVGGGSDSLLGCQNIVVK